MELSSSLTICPVTPNVNVNTRPLDGGGVGTESGFFGDIQILALGWIWRRVLAAGHSRHRA